MPWKEGICTNRGQQNKLLRQCMNIKCYMQNHIDTPADGGFIICILWRKRYLAPDWPTNSASTRASTFFEEFLRETLSHFQQKHWKFPLCYFIMFRLKKEAINVTGRRISFLNLSVSRQTIQAPTWFLFGQIAVGRVVFLHAHIVIICAVSSASKER